MIHSGKHGRELLEAILDDASLDWYGKPWSIDRHPIPNIVIGSAIHEMAIKWVAEGKRIMQPAEDTTLVSLLYKLQGHYWVSGMSENLAREVAKDYARLLGSKYPADIIQAACDEWLMDAARKFFPKPGEIGEIMNRMLAFRKSRIDKVERLLAAAVPRQVEGE